MYTSSKREDIVAAEKTTICPLAVINIDLHFIAGKYFRKNCHMFLRTHKELNAFRQRKLPAGINLNEMKILNR